MKPSRNPAWQCYIFSRIIIGIIDFGTDLVQAVRLYVEGHPVWGSLTILFPLLGIVASVVAVFIGKLQRGDPMPCKKFTLLTLVSLASLFEAFFESGPQLILQLSVIWRGVLVDDVEVVFKEDHFGTSRWFLGVLSILALSSSFLSLTVTTMFYNDEKPRAVRPWKFFVGLGLTVFSILYRVFLASILFSVAPFWILGLAVMSYIGNVIVHKATGHSWECFLYSFTSLLCPGGYTKNQGSSSATILRSGVMDSHPRTTISEVERARINQENLLKRVYVSMASFSVTNLILLIAFIALTEIKIIQSNQHGLIPIASARIFLYTTSCVLLSLATIFILLYVREIRFHRDFTRNWEAITPKTQRSQSRVGTLNSNGRHGSDFRPSAPEQQLPLNAKPYIEVIHDDQERSERPKSPLATKFATPGNSKCGSDSCVCCELITEGSIFRSTMTGKEYRFMTTVSCNAKNVIYLVTCSKCKKQYVGKTEQELRQRHYGHRREIETQSSMLGKHFAQECGYTNWRMQIIDQGASNELQRREGYWQHELMTFQPWGLNIRDELNGQVKAIVK